MQRVGSFCYHGGAVAIATRVRERTMHERFTDRARRVMDLAVEEARRFRHKYVGTEHILLGLVRLGDGVAAEILRICGVSLAAVRQEIERIVQHGPGDEPVVLGKLRHTPRAATAFQWAAEEARFLDVTVWIPRTCWSGYYTNRTASRPSS